MYRDHHNFYLLQFFHRKTTFRLLAPKEEPKLIQPVKFSSSFDLAIGTGKLIQIEHSCEQPIL